MKFQLFTKTYSKDCEWLWLALRSVQHYFNAGFTWYIVCEKEHEESVRGAIRKGCEKSVNARIVFKTVEEVWPESMEIREGYLRQQWIKMNAHRLIGKDIAWNWDSDVIMTRAVSTLDLLGTYGKPYYFFSPFNDLIIGGDKEVHEGRMAFMREVFAMESVNFEWMRCMPIVLHGEILEHGSRSAYWQRTWEKLKRADQRVSEFNIMGQFCYLNFPDTFEWVNAQTCDYTFSGNHPRAFCKQYWSHGGTPADVQKIIEEL